MSKNESVITEKSTKNTDSVEEQRFADYLRENPDFFQRHDELLAALTLPRKDAAGTISLQGRQVQQLREQQSNLRGQLEELLNAARENTALEQRIQNLVLELLALDSDSDSDRIQQAVERIRERFGIDYIVLRMADGDNAESYRELAPRVKHLSSVCDDRLPSALVQALFEQEPESVRSCALIPVIRDKVLTGVLALGSRAPDRFHPKLGAMYLDRLGAMLGALASR